LVNATFAAIPPVRTVAVDINVSGVQREANRPNGAYSQFPEEI